MFYTRSKIKLIIAVIAIGLLSSQGVSAVGFSVGYPVGANLPAATDNLYYGNASAGSTGSLLLLELNAQEKLRVDSSGNLTASGNVVGSQLCIDTDCRNAWPSGGGISQWVDDTGGAIYYNGGSVGIGITPSRLLHVAGSPPVMWLEDTSGLLDDKKIQFHVLDGRFEINSRKDDGNTRIDNIFVADMGTGNVGIGTSEPEGKLHINSATAGTVIADAGADDLVVENSSHGGISILTPSNNRAQIYFGNPASSVGALVRWVQDDGVMQIGPTNELHNIWLTNNVGIGTNTPGTYKLNVAGDLIVSGDGNDIYVNAIYGREDTTVVENIWLGDDNDNIRVQGNLCIDDDCKSSWGEVTSGTVYTAAGGLILNGSQFEIASGGVINNKIANNAVTSGKISDGTILNADISDSAVTSAKIATDTITAVNIATGAVATAEILDGTIATADIANSAVTDAKISSVAWSKITGAPSFSGITGSGTNNYLTKWTTAGSVIGNSLIYDDGTNVGIGTTAPTGKLTVKGSMLVEGTDSSDQIKTYNSGRGLEITGMPSGVGFNQGSLFVNARSSGDSNRTLFGLGVQNAQIFRVDVEGDTEIAGSITQTGAGVNSFVGNVGIGTTNPGTYKLNVNGTGYFSSTLRVGDTIYVNSIYGRTSGTAEDIWLGDDGDTIKVNDKLAVSNSVTIGSTNAPTHKLDIVTNNNGTKPQIMIHDIGTGDASIQFGSSMSFYTIGKDTSDSNKFKISRDVWSDKGLGTNDLLTLDTSGNLTTAGSLTIGSGALKLPKSPDRPYECIESTLGEIYYDTNVIVPGVNGFWEITGNACMCIHTNIPPWGTGQDGGLNNWMTMVNGGVPQFCAN